MSSHRLLSVNPPTLVHSSVTGNVINCRKKTNLETRGDESAHLAYAVSSRLTVRPVCLRDALDSDLVSSQPVPRGVMAGQRDKEEIGGIGGVKYRLLH